VSHAEKDATSLHPKRVAKDTQFVHVGDKRLKKLQKIAWEAGWWPETKRKGILWLAPDEVGQVMVHGSNSDHHAYDNLVAEFRKRGLDV
jgi:hypothetical protein